MSALTRPAKTFRKRSILASIHECCSAKPSFNMSGHIYPALRYNDACFNIRMLGEQVEKISTIKQFKRFAFGKFESCFAVAAGGCQNALRSTLVLDRSK